MLYKTNFVRKHNLLSIFVNFLDNMDKLSKADLREIPGTSEEMWVNYFYVTQVRIAKLIQIVLRNMGLPTKYEPQRRLYGIYTVCYLIQSHRNPVCKIHQLLQHQWHPHVSFKLTLLRKQTQVATLGRLSLIFNSLSRYPMWSLIPAIEAISADDDNHGILKRNIINLQVWRECFL